MHAATHFASHLLTALFFLGAVGSLATVVLFAIELVRIARNKDDDTESQIITDEDNFSDVH